MVRKETQCETRGETRECAHARDWGRESPVCARAPSVSRREDRTGIFLWINIQQLRMRNSRTDVSGVRRPLESFKAVITCGSALIYYRWRWTSCRTSETSSINWAVKFRRVWCDHLPADLRSDLQTLAISTRSTVKSSSSDNRWWVSLNKLLCLRVKSILQCFHWLILKKTGVYIHQEL